MPDYLDRRIPDAFVCVDSITSKVSKSRPAEVYDGDATHELLSNPRQPFTRIQETATRHVSRRCRCGPLRKPPASRHATLPGRTTGFETQVSVQCRLIRRPVRRYRTW